jgi:hypothetical protein
MYVLAVGALKSYNSNNTEKDQKKYMGLRREQRLFLELKGKFNFNQGQRDMIEIMCN